MNFAVVVEFFSTEVSPAAVELAAWAGSATTIRPAAPRSALRTKGFMNEPRWVGCLNSTETTIPAYAVENELKMNGWSPKTSVVVKGTGKSVSLQLLSVEGRAGA